MAIIRFLPKFDLVFNTDKGQFEWIDPADDFYDSISGKGVTQVTLSGIFWLTLTLRLKNGNVKQFTQFRFGLDVSKLRESLQAYEQYVMDEKEFDDILSELGTKEKGDSIIPEKSSYYRDGNQPELDTTNSVTEYASTETRPDFVDHQSERTHEEKIKAKGVSFEEVMNIEIMKTRIREELMKNPDAEFDEDNLEMRFVGMKNFIRDTRNYLQELSSHDEGHESSNADILEPSAPELKVVDSGYSDIRNVTKETLGLSEDDHNEAGDENFAFPAGNDHEHPVVVQSEPKDSDFNMPLKSPYESNIILHLANGGTTLSADYARSHSTNSGDQYRYLEEFSTDAKWDIKSEYGDIIFIDNVKNIFRRAIPGRLFVTIPFELIDSMYFNEDEIVLSLKPEFENYHVFPKGGFIRFSLNGKTRRSRKEFEAKLIRMRKRING